MIMTDFDLICQLLRVHYIKLVSEFICHPARVKSSTEMYNKVFIPLFSYPYVGGPE